jgi:hypothetical protein
MLGGWVGPCWGNNIGMFLIDSNALWWVCGGWGSTWLTVNRGPTRTGRLAYFPIQKNPVDGRRAETNVRGDTDPSLKFPTQKNAFGRLDAGGL